MSEQELLFPDLRIAAYPTFVQEMDAAGVQVFLQDARSRLRSIREMAVAALCPPVPRATPSPRSATRARSTARA